MSVASSCPPLPVDVEISSGRNLQLAVSCGVVRAHVLWVYVFTFKRYVQLDVKHIHPERYTMTCRACVCVYESVIPPGRITGGGTTGTEHHNEPTHAVLFYMPLKFHILK